MNHECPTFIINESLSFPLALTSLHTEGVLSISLSDLNSWQLAHNDHVILIERMHYIRVSQLRSFNTARRWRPGDEHRNYQAYPNFPPECSVDCTLIGDGRSKGIKRQECSTLRTILPFPIKGEKREVAPFLEAPSRLFPFSLNHLSSRFGYNTPPREFHHLTSSFLPE